MKLPVLTPQEKKVAIFTLVSVFLGLAVIGLRTPKSTAGSLPAQAYQMTPVNHVRVRLADPRPKDWVVLDLNLATEQELARLPSLGPALAHAIVNYRAAHGPFQAVEDLKNVQGGVGPKRLQEVSQYLKITPLSQLADRETHP